MRRSLLKGPDVAFLLFAMLADVGVGVSGPLPAADSSSKSDLSGKPT
jgi:hypothetical protein